MRFIFWLGNEILMRTLFEDSIFFFLSVLENYQVGDRFSRNYFKTRARLNEGYSSKGEYGGGGGGRGRGNFVARLSRCTVGTVSGFMLRGPCRKCWQPMKYIIIFFLALFQFLRVLAAHLAMYLGTRGNFKLFWHS